MWGGEDQKIMIYFISGHRDLTSQEFKELYIPKIQRVLGADPGAEFVMGDYEGADYMAQEYLVELGLSERVTVYHMWGKPRHLAPGIHKTIGGFKSDYSRDTQMTKDSDFDIAFVLKPGRSGTYQNIMKRWRQKKETRGN